jgi:hypothetical protein
MGWSVSGRLRAESESRSAREPLRPHLLTSEGAVLRRIFRRGDAGLFRAHSSGGV